MWNCTCLCLFSKAFTGSQYLEKKGIFIVMLDKSVRVVSPVFSCGNAPAFLILASVCLLTSRAISLLFVNGGLLCLHACYGWRQALQHASMK